MLKEKNFLTVSAPATSANLGPGFDTLGVALDIRNEVTFYPGHPFSIRIFGEGSSSLPRTKDNLVYKSFEEAFKIYGKEPLEGAFVIKNRIPITRGLGSSAACSVMGAALVAKLLKLSKEETDELVIKTALKIEGHPDNIVPCYFGGLRLCVAEKDRVEAFPVSLPENLSVLLVVPRKKVSTAKARKVLPKKINLEDAVFNLQRACLLLWVFENNRLEFLKKAVLDRIHQEKRLSLVEGSSEVFQNLLSSSRCLGGWLSGSGSTMAFLALNENVKYLEQEALQVLKRHKFEARLIKTAFSKTGLVFHEQS